MQRQTNLEYIIAIVIPFIFIVHSTWIGQFPAWKSIFYIFYIGALLFVSAFLAAKAFNNQTHLWISQLKGLYIPYIAIVSSAVLAQMWMQPTSQAWLTALTPIPTLEAFQPTGLGYLWFVPMLLGLLVLFAFMHKYVPNDKTKVAILSAIWITTFLGRLYGSPLRTMDEFPLFMPVFSFGYFLGKGALNQLVITAKRELLIISLFAVGALTAICSFFDPKTVFQSMIERMMHYYGAGAILTITTILILMYLFRNAVANKLVTAISTSVLMIYLLEPYVSTLTSYLLYGNMNYYLTETWIFEIIRIPATILISIAIQFTLINRLKKFSFTEYFSKKQL